MNPPLSEISGEFAINLYQTICKSCRGNIVISPIGLQVLLTVIHSGAKGLTAIEIANVLQLFEDRGRLLNHYKNVLSGLDESALKLVMILFTDKRLPIIKNFKQTIEHYHLLDICRVGLKENPKGCKREINDIIKKKTDCKIKELFSTEFEAGGHHSLVLVNTVYFKLNWRYRFQESETKDMLFYVQPGLTVNTKMMFMKEKNLCIMYSKRLDAQILEIPCAENKLSVIIILPKKLFGLSDVESKLAALDLSSELLELWVSKVDVYLPKFSFEFSADMSGVLSKMGMPTAFTKEADFSGISSEPESITKITQRVTIEIGPETGKDFGSFYNAPLYAHVGMRCNHPFLFIILAQQEILLVGRFQNPDTKPQRIREGWKDFQEFSREWKRETRQHQLAISGHMSRLSRFLKNVKR